MSKVIFSKTYENFEQHVILIWQKKKLNIAYFVEPESQIPFGKKFSGTQTS